MVALVSAQWTGRVRIHGDTIDDKLASLVDCLDRRWFRTALRARTPDRDRLDMKHRRTARGVRLAVYWYHLSRRRAAAGGIA